jgi:DNA-binding response OmpR family regulator
MRILLVEDDLKLCDSLSFQLEKEGISVDVCHDGEDALSFISEDAFDLILLDRMIPKPDGLQVLKEIREKGIEIPVIFLTALGELYDRVDGLDAGADDYLVKPFAFPELMARIRSIRRRPVQLQSSEVISFGDLDFDMTQKSLSVGQQSCTLSKREADLLEAFMGNPKQILPRELLLSKVWGPYAEVEDGNLDNYVYFLRRRLKTLNSRLKLKAVRGIGYCLEDSGI